ncbi:MAG: hypothetical protein RLY57_62 [Candidatus Parcubacteria bacterium]|jgi:hypothetical protein
MKSIRNITLGISVIALFALPVATFAATTITTDIATSTTWDANGSPYIIKNSIEVVSGVNLTLNPGTIVQFDEGTGLNVSGSLVTGISSGKKTYITSLNDTTVIKKKKGDPITTPSAGDYSGIVFNAGSTGTLKNVEIRYADTAVNADDATLSITNAAFVNNNNGVETHDGSLVLKSNKFSNNNTPVLVDYSTTFTHDSNTFVNNGYNAIGVTGDMYGSNYRFTGDDASYVLFSNPSVASGNTLTIDNGVTITGQASSDSILVTGGTLNIGSAQANYRGRDDDHEDDEDENNGVTLDGINIQAYNGAVVNITGATIKNFGSTNAAVTVFNGSTATIKNSIIDNGGDGVVVFNDSTLDTDRVVIKNCSDGGIITFGNEGYDDSVLKMRNSELTANGFAIFPVDRTLVDVHNNSIHDNAIGVINNGGLTYDFTKNWWGSVSGPYNATTNATSTGDEVFDGITYAPFLKYDPLSSRHDSDERGHGGHHDSDHDKDEVKHHAEDRVRSFIERGHDLEHRNR